MSIRGRRVFLSAPKPGRIPSSAPQSRKWILDLGSIPAQSENKMANHKGNHAKSQKKKFLLLSFFHAGTAEATDKRSGSDKRMLIIIDSLAG